MIRISVLFLVLLCSELAVGQSGKKAFDRADYDRLLMELDAHSQKIKDGNEDQTLQFNARFKRAEEWALSTGDSSLAGQCYMKHFNYLSWSRSEDLGMKFNVSNAVWRYRSVVDQHELYETLENVAELLYDHTKRPDKMIPVLEKLCELADRTNNSIVYCLDLKSLYYELHMYDDLMSLYKDDARFYTERGNLFLVASAYNNIGLAQKGLLRTDSAISIFNRALRLLEDTTSMLKNTNPVYLNHFTNVVKWNLARVKVAEPNAEKELLAQELCVSGRRTKEARWSFIGFRYLVNYYYKEHNFDKALVYADSAIALADELGEHIFLTKVLSIKGRMLTSMNKVALADRCFERAEFLTDSLLKSEAYLNASIILAKVEAAQQKKEQERSMNAVEQAEMESHRQLTHTRWLILLSILGSAALALVLFLFYQVRKNRKLVIEQKQKVEKSLAEKEMLLKEIHHRVKNNLQIISSLLDLQSSQMDDNMAKAALEESKFRVQSIALLHHQLYRQDNLGEVELCAFTKELMHQVMSVFKKEDQPVEVKIDMPLTLITIDTAVPLGLILNELMTNSFKYALENGKNGTISIQLLPGDVDKGWMLIYRDNGKGLPQNQDINLAKTLGLRLVSRLSKQIKGSSEYRYDGGAEFTIRFRTAS